MVPVRISIRSRIRREAHRGVVALWTLLMIPVLLVMFAVVVEGVHLWLARVELENALEAAALASVKEWAEDNTGPASGWTAAARTLGQEYAAANTINQTSVSIDDNLGTYSESNPNENESCQGDLIFGAITEEEPYYVFDANEVPSCFGGARVLADVTSNNMDQDDNSWGISFPTEEDPWYNQNVLIDRIVIEVDWQGTGDLRFNFNPSSGLPPVLSDNFSQALVASSEPAAEQHDNYGFLYWFNTTSPTNPLLTEPDGSWPNPGPPLTTPQITFSSNADANGIATELTVTFDSYDDGMGNYDAGFSPGDRFRFGAGVERSNQGGQWSTARADDIGDVGVRITVYLKDINGNPWGPVDGIVGYFEDTTYPSNQCGNTQNPATWEQDDLMNWHILVHPIRLASPGSTLLIARDLPCPLNSGTNDGQSIVLALGTGGVGNYAVRAQATHTVPSLICSFLGIDFGGPFAVSACTTAMYDCELQRPRLIRVEEENFFCTP